MYSGEIKRLIKYKIFFFGILVSMIWAVIIALADLEAVLGLMPFLVLMDAGMMSIILLGASFYYEKQEGTMQSIIVTPIRLSTHILVKVLAMVTMGLISFVVVIGTSLIFHNFSIQLLPFALYVVVAVSAHSAIGYVLILYSRDFLAMLVKYMGVVIIFMLPMLLVQLDVISGNVEFIGLLSPTYAAQILFQSTIATKDPWTIVFSLCYLALIPAVLYPLVIMKRYEIVAMEG